MNQDISRKIEDFFSQFREQSFPKKQILVRMGEEPSGVFYLQAGLIKEYGISSKGDEVVVNIFKPGSFFPISWAINDTDNEYYFEAMSVVEVWKAPREKVIVFVKEQSEILYDLLARTFRGTDGIFKRMRYLMSGNARTRLVTELIIAAQRFGESQTTTEAIELDITEKELSARTGLTRETVNREMRVLKEKGLVVFAKNKRLVIDWKKLEEEI